MANQNQIKFGVGYQVDRASIEKVKQSLRDLQNIKIGDFKGTEEQLQNIQKTAKVVETALQKAFNPTLNTANIETFNTILKQSGRTIDTVYADFAKLGSQGRQAFTQVASQVMTTNAQLRETKSLLTTMGETMVNTVKWGIASSVMNTFTNSVRQAFEYVKNLDSALTDIRIVTGDSTQRMKEFAVQANQAAQSLGRSTMDYTKAALTFYQQGLNDEDVQARTQSVLVAQNITGAGQEMADYLTAVWNGYKVANEEAELYVDKLAAVADSSASDMSQLAVAMSKVASTANMLGVPIDSLNAQIATIVATTRQAPESVGNALKTIYARINDIATGADGAQISLGNYSEKMAEVGISVLDANGRLRDTGDVIDEVGQKWATLSREQQIYLARTMAGQRQYNNLLALFENWGRYTELVNVSMDAQGAAMEKNERYMDSLAAKMEQFGAAGERVKSALVNQNDLKGITDFGTKAVNLFASLIEGIGGGGNAMLALGSIATSVFGNVIGKQIGNMITKSQQAKASYQAMAKAMQNTLSMQMTSAYRDPDNTAYKDYIDNLQKVQRVWSVLTVEEKKAQEQRALEIESLTRQKEELLQTSEAANKFASSLMRKDVNLENGFVSGLTLKLEELQTHITIGKDAWEQYHSAVLSGDVSRTTQSFNNLKGSLEQIANYTGIKLPESLKNILNQSADVADFDILKNSFDQFINDIQTKSNSVRGFVKLSHDISEVNSKLKQTQANFDQLNTHASNVLNSQNAIKFASGIGQIASSVNTVINLFKTWNNENISFGEKLTQTFTTIGFMLPMVLGGIKNISTALGITGALQLRNSSLELKNQKQILLTKELIAVQDKLAELNSHVEAGWVEQKIALLREQARLKGEILALDNADLLANKTKLTIIKEQLISDVKNAGSLIKNFFSGPGGIIVTLGALATFIGVSIYKALNVAKEAAQQATKQMQAANDVYKQSKDNIDELKSSLESLKSAKNSFSQLTTGTKEWKSALEDVNNQVIELLEKYPQLAKNGRIITNSNGMLQISEEGQQYLLNQQRQAAQANAIGYLSSRQRSDQANREYEITQLSRNLGLGIFDSSVLDKTIVAYQEHGAQIFANTEELQKLIGANDKQITAIDKHKTEIIALAEKLTANTTATQSLTNSIITGTFINPDDIAKSINPDIFTAQYAKNVTTSTSDYSKYANLDFNKIAQEWAKQNQANSTIAKELQQYVQQSHGFLIEDTEGNQIAISENSAKQIAERYKQINSDTITEIEVSGGKIYQTLKNTSEKTELAFQDMLEAVTAANLDAEEITKQSEAVAVDFNRMFGEQASAVYAFTQGTLASGDLSLQDYQNLEKNWGTVLAKIMEIPQEKVQELLHSAAAQTALSLSNYIQSLPSGISQALKQLTKKEGLIEIPESVIKSIGASLQNAWKNGTYDEYLDILNSLETEDLKDFTTLVDSLGEEINSMDTNSFIDKMKELGISTENVTEKQIQNLIDKLKELSGININIQDNIGQLYEGTTGFLEKYAKDVNATLSKSEFESLSQLASGLNLDLSQYFDQTWKGTYKLKTTAEEFVATINNITLEGFEQKIQETEDKLNNLLTVQEYQNQGLTIDTLTNLISNSGTLKMSGVAKEQGYNIGASILSFMGDNSKGVQDILAGNYNQDAINYLIENLPKIIEGWDQVGQSIEEANSNLLLLNEQQQDAILAQEEMNQKLRQMQLDSDINTDEWHNLADYLEEMGGSISGVSQDVETFEENAEDLAQAILRFDSAIEQTTEHFDDWNQKLIEGQDSASIMAQVTNELQNVYKDLLDLPEQAQLTPDFTASQQNLQYLKQAIDGVDGAYEQLQMRAAADIIMQIQPNISFEAAYAQVQSDMAYLQSIIDQEDLNIEAGASLNNENFIAGLAEIVNALDYTGLSLEEATAKANAYVESLGINATVKPAKAVTEDVQEQVGWEAYTETVPVGGVQWLPNENGNGMTRHTYVNYIPQVKYRPVTETKTAIKEGTGIAFEVSNPSVKAGGNVKYQNSTNRLPSSTSRGSGSGGGSKGGGSTKQPSVAKISTDTISTKAKQTPYNPYEEVEKSYERQEDLLKDLDELEKHLQGEDRLNNIQKQNKELIKQNSIIEERQKISEDAAEQGSTAWYRNQLLADEALKDVVQFDPDGQVNETVSKQAITDAFNRQLAEQKAYYEAAQNSYNNWIENVWNKYSGEQQQANKKQKEQYDEDLKNAKKNAQDKIKIAEEEYNDRTKLLENYQKALEEDNKFYEQYLDNIEKLIENRIAESKIKVDLAFDFGQTERQWEEFENKFIKRLQKDDIFANAKASFRELQSYFNSSEITQAQKEIDKVRKEIALIQSGQYSSIYGITQQEFNNLTESDRNNLQKRFLDQATKDLQDYQKKLMDSLEEVQDKQEEIQELYLDSIDKAKDKMDDVISQYEKINDLVEHNIKLTELLYGDNAGFDIRNSYYNRQSVNNSRMLEALRQQQAYWQSQLNNATPNTEDWRRFKENLENVTDAINSALENQLDLLATKFENKIQGALANIQNKLTNGLGNTFLDNQWEFINDDDEAFLDAVNSKFGIDEVEQLYEDAAAGAEGNIVQQQRINKLMNDQLKALREKDKLTQYDIDRAKAALEVEKARMALEDARNNKTKMRLRRDSQGNYTYQYVADEEKLSDLQSALADAESQLYNMDKEHYKQQLNEMYDTYKDYLERRADLEREMQATQDANERARIQARIKLLEETYTEYADNITGDLQYTLSNYLTESAAAGLGVDLSQYSTAEQIEFLKDNLPYVNTEIQNLADTITGEDGILNSTRQYLDELTAAFTEYNQEVQDTLSLAGTSVLSIASTLDDQAIAQTEKWLGLYQNATLETQNVIQNMQQLLEEMQKFMNEDFSSSDVIQSLYKAEQMIQKILNPDQIDENTILTGTSATIGYGTLGPDQDINILTDEQRQALESLQNDYLTQQANFNTLADELALSDINSYTEAVLANADEILDNIYNTYKDDLKNRLIQLLLQDVGSLDNITSSLDNLNNSQTLDQNVTIEALFPNVTNHTEIEQALNNLVNMASQQAARPKP